MGLELFENIIETKPDLKRLSNSVLIQLMEFEGKDIFHLIAKELKRRGRNSAGKFVGFKKGPLD
jgi:hypothetical protein